MELKDLFGVWDSWNLLLGALGVLGGILAPGGAAAHSEGWDGVDGNAWDEILAGVSRSLHSRRLPELTRGTRRRRGLPGARTGRGTCLECLQGIPLALMD